MFIRRLIISWIYLLFCRSHATLNTHKARPSVDVRFKICAIPLQSSRWKLWLQGTLQLIILWLTHPLTLFLLAVLLSTISNSFFSTLILFYWRSCLVCCASQELCLSLYTNKICVKSSLALEIYKLAAFIILQQFWGKEQSLFAVGNVLTTISYSFWQATTSISLHFQKKVRCSLLGTQTWNLNEQW